MIVDVKHPASPYLKATSYYGEVVKGAHEINLDKMRARTYNLKGVDLDRGAYTEVSLSRVEYIDSTPEHIKTLLPIDTHESDFPL